MIYESTRDKNIKISSSEAILKGLSDDGGLFVLRDLGKNKIDIKSIINKNYYEIAEEILKIFLDFNNEEIKYCVENAYREKFSNELITPLVKLKNSNILELFYGATSAFKDIGLSILPYLTKIALEKTNQKEDILILTATSGDTGKAALEGFKNVDRTKIMVFYPNSGVSKVQEAQMKTQEGKNLKVCGIKGNFDDAQTGIKNLFLDTEFKKILQDKNIKLSSANSINIGRLIPQIVYYFVAYANLVNNKEIELGEKINFAVPTGNFGNILAGYYAKKLGLPVNKLICASNSNNILYDFLTTGEYNKNRKFLKTLSPSMDILISSNLERLLYYLSDCNNEYVKTLMKELKEKGKYKVSEDILKKIQNEFIAGYTTDKETEKVIKELYNNENYLLDTHTAVAYKVLLDNKKLNNKTVVLSTASPYKFTKSVYSALYNTPTNDEFELIEILNKKTKVTIPKNLINLNKKEILHNDVIEKDVMKNYILEKLGELK